jgi:hypothetical protein
MEDTIAIANPFDEQLNPVNIAVIENGYLVSCYRRGKYEQWYCINHEEVMEKLQKFI